MKNNDLYSADKQPAQSGQKRRFSRFSLATALVFVGLLCIPLGLYTNAAIRHRKMFGELEAIGAKVTYDYQYSADYRNWDRNGIRDTWEPRWLRSLLGDFIFHPVVGVSDTTHSFTDSDIEQLIKIRELRVLTVGRSVTDNGVDTLCSLKTLRLLTLEGTQISRVGLTHLHNELPNVEFRGRMIGIDEEID